ncbi:MAG: hypothetical protein IJX30_01150 [Clostridia bacterium]|nr:hypothetical protein [Clostridia bacterium]
MILFYILVVAYIIAINFYAFLLIKSARDKEKERELNEQSVVVENHESPISTPPEKNTGKLCITGLLGGAITLYVCMFIFKYKRSDLLLMVLMPLLGVLNVYLWVLLFRSGFSFLMIR